MPGAGTGLDCFYHPWFRCDCPEWATNIQQVHHQKLKKLPNDTNIWNDPNGDPIEGDAVSLFDANINTISLGPPIGSVAETFSVMKETSSRNDDNVASLHQDPPSLEGLETFYGVQVADEVKYN